MKAEGGQGAHAQAFALLVEFDPRRVKRPSGVQQDGNDGVAGLMPCGPRAVRADGVETEWVFRLMKLLTAEATQQ
jgi:hypothetical protein